MKQPKCEAPGLPEERIQEIARTTRNPNRGQVERVLRVAAQEGYAAGRATTIFPVPFGYVLVELGGISNLTTRVKALADAGSADAKSLLPDAARLLEANVRNARKS